jgi:hypothetical protein
VPLLLYSICLLHFTTIARAQKAHTLERLVRKQKELKTANVEHAASQVDVAYAAQHALQNGHLLNEVLPDGVWTVPRS